MRPKATWAEIEVAVDEQINQLRAQLIQDLLLLGKGEDWSELPEEERPKCPTCGRVKNRRATCKRPEGKQSS